MPTQPHTPTILVFGECLVDWFDGQAVAGGAPFNVARHLAALGLRPWFVSRVGNDELGRMLLEELRRWRVQPALVQVDAQRPTGQVRVHARGPGHEFEILPDQAYDHIEWTDAIGATVGGDRIRPPWLYFGTLAQRSADSRNTLARLRAEMPHRAFVDLNWRAGQVAPALALSMLDCADELKLSAEELGLLLAWTGRSSAHCIAPPAAHTRCAGIGALLAGRRVQHLIVTYGDAGYASWDAQGRCELRATAVPLPRLVDTVGAGDAFTSITLAGRLLAWPRELTLARANEFAAAICAVRGAVPSDPDFYYSWMRRWQMDPPVQPTD
jgi:fructokinase